MAGAARLPTCCARAWARAAPARHLPAASLGPRPTGPLPTWSGPAAPRASLGPAAISSAAASTSGQLQAAPGGLHWPRRAFAFGPSTASSAASLRLVSSRAASAEAPAAGPQSGAAVEAADASDPTARRASSGRESSGSGGGGGSEAPPPEMTLLYDGDCPLCLHEVNMLRRRDAGHGRLRFVDVASDSYDPSSNAGLTFEVAMARIHGILPDGSIVRDVEVFRRAYNAVGLGWVYAFLRFTALAAAADRVYGVWARNRMLVTGRGSFEAVLEARRLKQQQQQQQQQQACGREGACGVPPEAPGP